MNPAFILSLPLWVWLAFEILTQSCSCAPYSNDYTRSKNFIQKEGTDMLNETINNPTTADLAPRPRHTRAILTSLNKCPKNKRRIYIANMHICVSKSSSISTSTHGHRSRTWQIKVNNPINCVPVRFDNGRIKCIAKQTKIESKHGIYREHGGRKRRSIIPSKKCVKGSKLVILGNGRPKCIPLV